MEYNQEFQNLLEELKTKFHQDGENVEDYLEGLSYRKYLDYWEYINLTNLLNLQQPETNYPDEMVFIIYHQITELFFKLSLWELEQVSNRDQPTKEFWTERLGRLNNYFRVLTQSFSIMSEGLDPEQFTKFRMALVPASGFQSVQYRMIELACTPVYNLVHADYRKQLERASIEQQFEEIYWKRGATIANTGEKTLTLKRFEDQYQNFLIDYAKKWQGHTLEETYNNLPEAIREDQEVIKALKTFDKYVNVHWPKAHFQTARRYLEGDYGEDDEGTGGTNYKEYLPPQIQQRIFFPGLWTAEERKNWGK